MEKKHSSREVMLKIKEKRTVATSENMIIEPKVLKNDKSSTLMVNKMGDLLKRLDNPSPFELAFGA
uniref:Putative ovule protein n=1 Tax=Solanum chacoense TaxID=4108 RepID=A0A0V0GK02_SOLCH